MDYRLEFSIPGRIRCVFEGRNTKAVHSEFQDVPGRSKYRHNNKFLLSLSTAILVNNLSLISKRISERIVHNLIFPLRGEAAVVLVVGDSNIIPFR